jgi:hypothetical protein
LIKYIKQNWPTLVSFAIVVAAVFFRLTLYGDPRLSIANNDTESYITSSNVNLLSVEAFTGRRSFTTNLVFQAFKPENKEYRILVNGSGDTAKRRVQETFTGIVLMQVFLSILGWSILALAAISHIRRPGLKILMALLVCAFGFTPQLVDWDSVLTSESLTFSLFALQFGLLILLAFRFTKSPTPTPSTIGLTILWLMVVFFWSFVKDGNLYNLPADGLIIAAALLFKPYRKQKLLYAALLALIVFFVLGWTTAGRSSRADIQLQHVYEVNILSLPAASNYMKAQGMPDPASAEFSSWFEEHGKDAYLALLVSHPGYVITHYFKDIPMALSENLQVYFTTPDLPWRKSFIPFGNLLHLTNSASILMDAILLGGIWMIALKRNPKASQPWAWLATWVFLSAHLNLFISIFGDTYALPRHALMAATMFRLFMWLFVIVEIDLALLPEQKIQPTPL